MLVSEFLDQKGFRYKPRSSGELVVEECPFCGDIGWHFYIHRETGLCNCKKCDGSGNLWTLRKTLGDVDPTSSVTELLAAEKVSQSGVGEAVIAEYCKTLEGEPSTVNWLLARCISRDSIRRFRLGLVKEGMSHWLTIPYYRGGKPVNVKFRTLPPSEKAFRVLPDHETPLYNVDALDRKVPVFVTEGELDAIVLIQEGYENTVSLPLGAGTFAPNHFDALVDCGRINLVLDADSAGRRATSEIGDRLGPERCFTADLPVKDVTDFFQRFHRADFEALLEEAQPVGRSVVLSMAEVFRDLERRRSAKGKDEDVSFPWKNVDRIVGALQPGWLVVLQATPKIGKTTFCLNVLSEIARRQGHPGLMYCLEMSPDQLLERVISNVRGVPVARLSGADIVMAKGELYNVPLYFGYPHGALSAERVFETIHYSVRRFGIKLVVFDHLHFLCRSIDRITPEVGRVIRDFKLLFEELKVPGIIVTHPTKMSTNEAPGIYGSRDSGEISGDADVIVSLYRRPLRQDKISEDDFTDQVAPTYESRTLVRVVASRYTAGGSAVLYFDDNSMRFEESSG